MLDQKVTLRWLKVENPAEPEEGEQATPRYRGDLHDFVDTVEYRGAVFPSIHYTDRFAMVEVHDFETGAVHYHFNVVDVTVEPLNENQAKVAANKG